MSDLPDPTEHHRMRTIEDLRKEFLEIEALRKELAEAKAALEVYDRTFPKKSELELHAALANARQERDNIASLNSSLISQKEAANARIAALENALKMNGDSLHGEVRRAERAEAEADSLRATIDNMRAMNIKLTMDATSQVLAAEAKCKGLQEALEYYAAYERFGFRCETARAALNPSGREG